ncbi:MAG: oligopeptide transporter protein, partial [Phycisphaerales bacterium]|nr:oligopeptide transporter protein [Phycisphaerales bacterium]
WGLVLMGVLIAITLELAGVPSLPFAVGVYLPIQVSVPIFLGGAIRWVVDRLAKRPGTESDMSPGTLLSTGYIAGGTLGGVVIAFLTFAPKLMERINVRRFLGDAWAQHEWPAAAAFGALIVILLAVGFRKPEKNPPLMQRNLP